MEQSLNLKEFYMKQIILIWIKSNDSIYRINVYEKNKHK
jgi:hypothetical protein